MSVDHAERDPHDRRREQQPAPLVVGAADDHAERDADRIADRALARMPVPVSARAGVPEDVRRSADGSADGATIGREGGAVDADTQASIEGARGGGERLPDDVRAPMEQAFGRPFGDVRVHRGGSAERLSRTISAEAFTTGNDIFFGRGSYDPGSARGQRVLAHELGHVAQQQSGVHRLFGKKKTPEEKEEALQKKAAAKERKAKLVEARTELKAKDKAVRTKAKQVNAKNKQVSKDIKGSYTGHEGDPMFKPEALKRLEGQVKDYLDKERYVRSVARHEVLGGQEETEELVAEAELAEEQAVDELWASAPEDVRAFRPLRYDEFDQALNEVRQALNESLSEEHQDVANKLQENEDKFGAPMSPSKAAKKVREQRDLERRQARVAKKNGVDLQQAKTDDMEEFRQKGEKNIKEAQEDHHTFTSEKTRLREEAMDKGLDKLYATDSDIEDAAKGLKKAGKAMGYVSKAGKKGSTKVLPEGTPLEAGELASASVAGLGDILTMISSLLGFSNQVADINKGVADPGAKLEATKTAVGVLSTGSKLTRKTLRLAREGVEAFGGQSQVISDVGAALPIVGLVTSALAIIDNTLELIPLGERLGSGLESVDEAVLAKKGPLAASFKRVNSRNAQLVEKSTFSLAKNATMLGLHIAEIASAGGFGIPAAAKLTLTITDYAHRLGHKIYDTVNESQSSTAKTDFGVKHKEGASRDVLKYDIGTSIDVIIVSAQKHKLEFAREVLVEYGMYDQEIDTMRHHEIREKVLDKLDAEGDPKTVTEKVQAAKKSVKETLGLDDKPGKGGGEEKSTLDKIVGVPKKIGKAISGLPAKIDKKLQEIKDAHTDAKMIVEEKNKLKYGGRSDRGSGSSAFYFLRGSDKNEKSLGKVRQELSVNGTKGEDMPRTISDKEKRTKREDERAPSKEKAAVHQFDPAFARKVTALSNPELFDLLPTMKKDDPFYEGNLEYLKFEVERRNAEAGVRR
jgi:hypothetical protein